MITHFEQIPTYIVCGVFTSFHFASQSNGHLLCFPLNKSAFPAAIWYLDVFGHMIPQMLYRIASHYHTQSGSWVFLRHMDFYHWKFNKLSRGKPYHSVVPVICDFIPYIHHGFCGNWTEREKEFAPTIRAWTRIRITSLLWDQHQYVDLRSTLSGWFTLK